MHLIFRLHNKGVYVKMGLRKMVGRKMCKELHKEIRLEVDGKLVELPQVEGIIILNILRQVWLRNLERIVLTVSVYAVGALEPILGVPRRRTNFRSLTIGMECWRWLASQGSSTWAKSNRAFAQPSESRRYLILRRSYAMRVC
jgi:hypothetical protein